MLQYEIIHGSKSLSSPVLNLHSGLAEIILSMGKFGRRIDCKYRRHGFIMYFFYIIMFVRRCPQTLMTGDGNEECWSHSRCFERDRGGEKETKMLFSQKCVLFLCLVRRNSKCYKPINNSWCQSQEYKLTFYFPQNSATVRFS